MSPALRVIPAPVLPGGSLHRPPEEPPPVGRRRAAWLCVWLAGFAGGGCGDDASPGGAAPCPPPRDPALEVSVEVGTGEARFEPLDDGDTLPLAFGPQGGWHVWVSVRADGLTPGARGCLDPELVAEDGTVLSGAAPVMPRLDDGDGDGVAEIVAWPALVPDAACAVGEPATLRVLVADRDGRWGEDAREVVVGPGAVPPGPCVP